MRARGYDYTMHGARRMEVEVDHHDRLVRIRVFDSRKDGRACLDATVFFDTDPKVTLQEVGHDDATGRAG